MLNKAIRGKEDGYADRYHNRTIFRSILAGIPGMARTAFRSFCLSDTDSSPISFMDKRTDPGDEAQPNFFHLFFSPCRYAGDE